MVGIPRLNGAIGHKPNPLNPYVLVLQMGVCGQILLQMPEQFVRFHNFTPDLLKIRATLAQPRSKCLNASSISLVATSTLRDIIPAFHSSRISLISMRVRAICVFRSASILGSSGFTASPHFQYRTVPPVGCCGVSAPAPCTAPGSCRRLALPPWLCCAPNRQRRPQDCEPRAMVVLPTPLPPAIQKARPP